MSSSNPPTGGVGGTTFGALSSIGSDLSVSVSFNIARELLGAADDEQISEDELIGLVLGFAIVFTALQSRIQSTLVKRRIAAVEEAKKLARKRFAEASASDNVSKHSLITRVADVVHNTHPERDALVLEEIVEAAGRAALAKLADRRSMLDFLHLLVGICQRICVAISIQLLAASVRAQQPSRLVRTVSLIALAAFFVFVESLTARVLV
jgi:hypothetical protein